MNNYFVKTAIDKGDPLARKASSVEAAARGLADELLLDNDAIIYVWTERMWAYELSPIEYYVWQVKNVSG